MSRQAWMTALRVAFLIATVIFGWWWLRGDWPQVQEAIATVSPWRALASVLTVLAGLLCTGIAWVWILRMYGYAPPRSVSFPVFFVGQLGKYIPGSVWSFGAQADMARRHGVPIRTTIATGLVFVYWNLATAAVAGSIAIWTGGVDVDFSGWIAAAGLLVAILAMLPPVVAVVGRRLDRKPSLFTVRWADVGLLILLMAAAWITYGVAMQLLIPTSAETVGSMPPATFAGIFAISYILGLLVFFAPAGLGVREVALTVLLTPWLGTAAATAVALLTRVVHTAADFAIAALAWAIGRLVQSRGSDRGASPSP